MFTFSWQVFNCMGLEINRVMRDEDSVTDLSDQLYKHGLSSN